MKKLINSIPSHVRNHIEEQISAHLFKMYGKVDPKFLKEYANIIGRSLEDVQDVKDTEDYNLDVISKVVDWSMKVYMEAGQKKIRPGDGVHVEGAHKFYLGVNTEYMEAKKALESGDYQDYPFCLALASELRSQYLLQTQRGDTFAGLMEVVEKNIGKFMSKSTWKKVKKAMDAAEERFSKQPLEFLEPMEGMEQGELRELSAAKMKQYKLKYFKRINEKGEAEGEDVPLKVDVRFDNFDMVALKDLALILEGKKTFDYFSMAPGFFAKFMKELVAEGIDALVFKVDEVSNTLIEIKETKFYSDNNNERSIHFSPMKASIALIQAAAVGVEEVRNGNPFFDKINYKFIEEKNRYYIVVDGTIAAQRKEEYVLGYEGSAFNEVRVACGEVFLFENRPQADKDPIHPMLTRLYFSAYNPSLLHPIHQHGGVVFGNHDQSMHSCWDKEGDRLNVFALDNYKRHWYETIRNERVMSEAYSPAVTAARLHFLEDQKRIVTQLFLEEKFDAVVFNMAMSLYEMSPFTMGRSFMNLQAYRPYKQRVFLMVLSLVISNYAPLSKRMLLKEYVDTGKASYKVQPTWYNKIAKDLEDSEVLEYVALHGKFDRIEELMKKGLTYDEAKKKQKEEWGEKS